MPDTLLTESAKFAANATQHLFTGDAPWNPYYPPGSQILGYVANERGVPALLAMFFGACTVLFVSTYYVAKRVDRTLTRGELSQIMWFVLSGCIHIFFEGYYAANFLDLGTKQTVIGQLWKEYAFSDSRYLTQNAFVLCMETVTASCWGPGCLIIAALIMLRHPMRHPIQIIVSMGQFYGDVLYYTTSAFDHYILGITYSRPETFYFWFYFVIMNAFWIVIPGWLIYDSTVQSAKAFRKLQQVEGTKKVT
ncbi:hypothetical protein LTR62_001052 [Meristemomyces frigidus]|uniref:EXPERA domain-containing protein n=1 Tax=Meristemomyces frigidus TaxID=1508187 RepID=A0AAN7T9C6_9PEZI|nr:hypothetical protein LTR62_001052 [Meristemomyces frigidus]